MGLRAIIALKQFECVGFIGHQVGQMIKAA
ncbi:Uncharacterised protein [Vibrio cholerae]|nr:Uncharacterised protein [Vibrio cholerae]